MHRDAMHRDAMHRDAMHRNETDVMTADPGISPSGHGRTMPPEAASSWTTPPHLSHDVERVDLLNLLRDSNKPIVLLCAAAGYGKSTLAAQFHRSDRRQLRLWCNLTEADNDPVTLARHLLAGLDGLVPLGPGSWRVLEATPTPPLEAIITTVQRAVRACDPLLLSFDNTHVVMSPTSRSMLAAVIDARPSKK
jgi:ATP/maltotriose-dependent transcriptional regulator MalT